MMGSSEKPGTSRQALQRNDAEPPMPMPLASSNDDEVHHHSQTPNTSRYTYTSPARASPVRFAAANALPSPSRLASHASDMGRKLAQERFKNEQLLHQISTLEEKISLLEKGNMYVSPVRSRGTSVAANSPMRNKQYLDHIHELQEALKLESQCREAAEKKAAHYFVQTMNATTNFDEVLEGELHNQVQNEETVEVNDTQHILRSTNDTFISEASNPSIANLFHRTSVLLSGFAKNDSPMRSNYPQQRLMHQPFTNEECNQKLFTQQMQDYHLLLAAFHSEQQSHASDVICREDVLWLFEELERRFEELRRGYEQSMSSSVGDLSAINDIDEWKECLMGLADIVSKSTDYSFNHSTDHTIHDNNIHTLQEEVRSLRQRLDSSELHHSEAYNFLNDNMESLKRSHKKQLDDKCEVIERLRSEIAGREESIAQMKHHLQQEQQWLETEKRNLQFTKEGSAARIRYLEDIIRSLQVELKQSKASKTVQSDSDVPTSNFNLRHELQCGKDSNEVASERARHTEQFNRTVPR